jgi:hypothetical protein
MIRKSLNWNVKQICTMMERGTILMNNPLQRASGQWKHIDQSLLIDSLFRYFMPIVVAIQTSTVIDEKNVNAYDIIDGKQRLTTIASYLKDEFILLDCEPIKLSTGETYDISNKKFSELSEEAQEDLKGTTIYIWGIELEEDDDEETVVEDIFCRLNNGKVVSKEHLALVKANKNIKDFVHKTITENPLFMNVAHYADGAVKKSDREMTILQSIVFVSGLDYNSFAAKDIEKFFIENTISEDVMDKVEGYFVDIAEAFKHEHNKFANKLNISAMVSLLDNNKDTEKVQEFIQYYSKAVKAGDGYRIYCGAGSVKKDTVKNRVKALQKMFDTYVKISKPSVTPPSSNNSQPDDEESEICVNFIPSNVMNAIQGSY